MTKFAKFRNSPGDFFKDSKNSLVRRVGGLLVPTLFERDLVMDLLEDPEAALAHSGIPGVQTVAKHRRGWLAKRRKALIDRAGQPTISVVMAAHNASSTIERALASVLNQTNPKLEVIVVDDASTDNTRELVTALREEDPRIQLVLNSEQRGAAATRNVGLAHSTGEYLTFHDADDESHPEKLERQLAALLANPSAVVCVCNFRRTFPDGRRAIVNGRRFAKNVVSMLFPREPVFARVGYMFDLRVGEDTEYYKRIRTVFGRDREIHMFQTLYLAQFEEDSLLFSNAETRIEGDNVHYQGTEEAANFGEEIETRMRAIEEGSLDPFVPFIV